MIMKIDNRLSNLEMLQRHNVNRLIRASLAAIFFLCSIGLSARGSEDPQQIDTPQAVVQAGSAAFIVHNALFLFPEARDSVVAVADGNQGNGFFLGDLVPSLSGEKVLPRRANTEAILAHSPQVVVMKDYLKKSAGAPLESMGLSTLYLNLESPEAWQADIDSLGELFGNQGRADELKDLMSRRIEAVNDSIDEVEETRKPRVLFLYWSVKDGAAAVNVPPADWIQTRMVEMAGGKPVWTDSELGNNWNKVNFEQIAVWNPDVILVAAYHIPASEAVDVINSDPGWNHLAAVENGKVMAFPADYHSWDQPDIRWLLGLQWMASKLHPQAFPNLDMEGQARDFYYEMFGMDDAAFDALILPRLTGLE